MISFFISLLSLTYALVLPTFNETNNGFNSTCITDNDCFGDLLCGGSTGTLCSSCGPQIGENNGCTNQFHTICGNCAIGLGLAYSAGFSCLSNCA